MSNNEHISANTEPGINDLIKQAELMQLKLQLEVQFNKNMEFLKAQAPVIYERFLNHKPKEQKVFIDENGYLNLINIQSRNPAFNEDPKTFAKNQVKTFMSSPTRFITGFKATTIVNPKHIHPLITNDALDEYKSMDLESHYNPDNPIGLLVMVGCGLGYQIEEIANNYDVRNLFIYDSNKDSFYASLFTIDWRSIVEKFKSRGGVVKLDAGEGLLHVLTHLRSLPYEIGMFNLVATHVYVHTNSKRNTTFVENYKKEFHLYGTALGFFDDEQVSFAHTIYNINDNKKIFTKHKHNESPALPPVFLVGNGPSLDTLIEFIRENKNKAIIISCGSALASLYRLGIKPDYHVELERNLTVAKMLELGTDIDYTKDIPLLGLNNVCPDTAELFKESYLIAKPSDIGSSILKKVLKKQQYFELEACNPTVTNCGMSYAIALGFSEIYLLGTDLGIKNEDNHHSKFSIWKEMDKSREDNPDTHKDTLEDYSYSDSRYPIKGNFSDTVLTTNVLDSSRKNMELIIANNPSIEVFNPNDGAHIDGAKPIKPEKLSVQTDNIRDKKALTKELLDNNFENINFKEITEQDVHNNYTALYFKVLEGLELPEKCDNLKDVYEHMQRVFKNLKILEETDRTTSMLVMGSIQVHFSMLYYYCLRASTKEEMIQCYDIGKKYYDRFIEQATAILKEEPLRLDDTGLLKS